jgi:hypothetical protein
MLSPLIALRIVGRSMDATVSSIAGALTVGLLTVLIARWFRWKFSTFFLLLLLGSVCGSFAGMEIASYLHH